MRKIFGGLFLVMSVIGLSLPTIAAQSSYTWSVSCKGSGIVSASWSWLQDGAIIANSTSTGSCSGNGSGAVPSNANGITASLFIHVGVNDCGFSRCYCASDYASLTQAFDPSKGVSISLHVSASANKNTCLVYFGPGSATFRLSS